MGYENVNNTANFQRQVLGQKGFRLLDGAASGTADEEYRALTVISDAVITATNAAGTGIDGTGDNLTSLAVPAGITIYGRFTSISTASGTVIAYIA